MREAGQRSLPRASERGGSGAAGQWIFSLILNNRHLLDVNIFVQHDGQPDRIATVTSATSRSIVLPVWMLGQSKAIRIIAEPIGDETSYTTDVLVVQPGQIIELNVESLIARSNYTIQ